MRESRESGKIAEEWVERSSEMACLFTSLILCQRILGLQGHQSFLTVNVDKVFRHRCSSPSFATWAQVATPFSQAATPGLAGEGTDV